MPGSVDATKETDSFPDAEDPGEYTRLVKHSLIEFYLDDLLIECYSLPQDATGRIGLVGAAAAFGELRAWSTKPTAAP